MHAAASCTERLWSFLPAEKLPGHSAGQPALAVPAWAGLGQMDPEDSASLSHTMMVWFCDLWTRNSVSGTVVFSLLFTKSESHSCFLPCAGTLDGCRKDEVSVLFPLYACHTATVWVLIPHILHVSPVQRSWLALQAPHRSSFSSFRPCGQRFSLCLANLCIICLTLEAWGHRSSVQVQAEEFKPLTRVEREVCLHVVASVLMQAIRNSMQGPAAECGWELGPLLMVLWGTDSY